MAKSFKDYEQEGWSKNAPQYERVTLPLTSQAFEPILASFGNLRGKKLLDVCTGPGHLAGEAAARGALVDAVDFSEAMVREAKARFSGISFMEGDAEALPYDDVSFDAVACCFGLLHLPNPAQGVREAYRVLKPGGRYFRHSLEWARTRRRSVQSNPPNRFDARGYERRPAEGAPDV